MKAEKAGLAPQNARRWRRAAHRGVALGLTMALHLAVFVLITRPAVDEEDRRQNGLQDGQALQLRFTQPLLMTPERASTLVSTRAAVALSRHTSPLAASIKSKSAVMPTAQALSSRASESHAPELDTGSLTVRAVPSTSGSADGDGGFADRLGQARRSYSVGPLPGSDTPRVGGIQLIDSKTQGIAAKVRVAQRLFGVVNHHCVDVDAWYRMSPQELIARHISLSDIAQVDAENQCNRPMGLSF